MSSMLGVGTEPAVTTTANAVTPTAGTTHSVPATAMPRLSTPRFPVRIGITWKKGEKLEAMDFSRTWYPSKIVEIDEAAKHVLIHFEGWNQRYDEWVAMDSDKLRPVTRHSERKDKGSKKRRIHPHPIYRPGEHVMAKWTDCKKYPAKVSRLMEDGMYEVIFYDGVSRMIQPMNIQPMPEEMKNMKFLSMKAPPTPKKKLSFKHIKVSLPESVRRKKKELAMEKSKLPGFSNILARRKRSAQKFGSVIGSLPTGSVDREPGPSSANTSRPKHTPLKMKQVKKSGVEPEVPVSSEPTIECVQMAGSSSDITSVVPAVTTATQSSSSSEIKPADAIALSVPISKSVEVKNDEDPKSEQTTVILALPVSQSVPQTTGTSVEAPSTAGEKPVVPRKRKKRSHTDLSFHSHQRKRRKIKIKQGADMARAHARRPPSLGTIGRAKSADAAASTSLSPSNVPLPALPAEVFVPSKAFIVEEDHNPFKCPHEGCNKDFRKENLLAYHIKYYHTEPEMPPAGAATTAAATPGGTPTTTTVATDTSVGVTSPLLPPSSVQSPSGTPGKKRRKKTNSVCSTDSDVSVSSKGKSSKRHRHNSEISVTTASPDLTNVKPTQLPQEAEDAAAVDTEDEDGEADVVNCVCGHRETNGLMIQCDVCMCWQHFACVDTKNAGVPPANYVCSICENTPGVRDSCRFLYDLSWERRGELPSFPFITENSSEHLKTVACKCNSLISSLQVIKSALHSTRRQIKISREETDPEFQLWQTDWDNWTKPEEDLSLTPCSADPEPSPTPSTFLFPSAPNPNPVPSSAHTTEPNVVSPSASVSSLHSSSSSASLPTTSVTSATSAVFAYTTTSSSATAAPTSITTTIIEVTSMSESPPPPPSQASPALHEHSHGAVTPPSGNTPAECLSPPGSSSLQPRPIQTPSVVRGSLMTTLQDCKSDLIKDLFPGPSGDATSFSSISNETELSSQTDSRSELTTDGTVETTKDKADSSDHETSQMENKEQQSDVGTTTTASTSGTELLPPVSSSQSGCQLSDGSMRQSEGPTAQGDQAFTAQTSCSEAEKTAAKLPPHNGYDKVLKPDMSSTVYQKQVRADDVAKSMRTLFVDVSNDQQHQQENYSEDDDNQDNDTDTAEESVDPYRNCEHNLLIHVTKVHSDIEKQLETLDEQISELENSEHTNPTVQLSEDNILNDIPALKKSLSKLTRTLLKVQRFCVHQ